MDQYLLNDILEQRDHLAWRDKINKINKEYHDKIYYEGRWKCLRSRRSGMFLWNWRNNRRNIYGSKIYHLHCANNGYEWVCLYVDLPKNY